MAARSMAQGICPDPMLVELETGPYTDVEVNLAPPNLLIVDDDELTLERLELFATGDGYTVHTAGSGADALQVIREHAISVILADVVMPGMSGRDLCRAVRETPLPSYVYTIMLSASDGPEEIVAALDCGADDFVSKHASKSELLARLRVGRRVAGLDMALRRQVMETSLRCHVDQLTHCYNMQHLLPELDREIARSRQHGHALSVMLCDVEHFRDINLVHGEAVGDEVLQQISMRLTAGLDDRGAWVAREDADRFVIVVPEAPLQRAYVEAEALSSGLIAEPIRCSAGRFPLTMRVGVVAVGPSEFNLPLSATSLLRAAEDCLATSKALGGKLVTGRAYRPSNIHDGLEVHGGQWRAL